MDYFEHITNYNKYDIDCTDYFPQKLLKYWELYYFIQVLIALGEDYVVAFLVFKMIIFFGIGSQFDKSLKEDASQKEYI